MNIKDAKIKIQNIKDKLKQWSKEYYENDNPSVSDEQYDALLIELKELENKYPSLITFDSPTQKVEGKATGRFNKVIHSEPMQSLDNAFNSAEILKFINDILNIVKEPIEFVVEHKIDGLSMSLIYKDGDLIQAVTRGDGTTGEDVTLNIKEIQSIPKHINTTFNYIEFRGEVFMPKNSFDALNKNLISKHLNPLANPRNAASGAIRQLDTMITKQRNLDAIIYAIPNALNFNINNEEEIVNYAKKIGFTSCFLKKFINPDDLIAFITNFDKQSIPYEIDGLVIKVNDIKLRKKIGSTNKFPKWAIAYKFPAQTAVTQLLDIFPTVGRTGRITYNAKLMPIRLAGTIVSAATLHNYNYIKDNNICIGDFVKVYKAGEIIPKVIGPVIEKRTNNIKPYEPINNCPSCYNQVVKIDGDIEQYCININCETRIIESLIHFCSRNAMNIEGLAESTIERFYKNNIIKNISDIYLLVNKQENILSIKGFKNKILNKLLSNIELSKKVSLERLLFALGIKNVGQKTAKDLAKKFLTMDKLMLVDFNTLSSINDIGPIISDSIVKYFNNPANIDLINKLKNLNVNMNYITNNKNSIDVNNTYYNKKIVITGILSVSREIIKEFLENKLGAIVTNNVSKNTDFILVGDNPGSKKDEGIKLGVKLINEIDINYK